MSTKDEVIEMIKDLPDDVTMLDIMEALHVRQQIEDALVEVAAGKVISHEQMKAEVAKWRKSGGRSGQAGTSGKSKIS